MASSYQYAYVKFYESDLEEIAMDVLSGDEFEMGYIYCPGSELHREQDLAEQPCAFGREPHAVGVTHEYYEMGSTIPTEMEEKRVVDPDGKYRLFNTGASIGGIQGDTLLNWLEMKLDGFKPISCPIS